MAGTDFPYRDFYAKAAKVIQIDIDPRQIGKRWPVDIALAGDAASTLADLHRACKERPDRTFLESMQMLMHRWRSNQVELESSVSEPIQSPRVMREISEAAPLDSIFVVDTGTATAWTARHLRVKRGQRYVLSGGLASMAFALPGAIGAQLEFPEQRVFSIAGDGGFSMLMADLMTAVRYELPIVFVVLNNSKLAFITLERQAQGLPDYGTTLLNPNFAALARACDAVGMTVHATAAIRPALDEALAVTDKPSVLDIAVDPDQLILPSRIQLKDAVNFGLAKAREVFATAE